MNPDISDNRDRFSTDDDEIDLMQLLLTLWKGRWVIIGCIIITVSLGVTYALTATPQYEAKAVVLPVSQEKQSGMLSQLGGLAALAGISSSSSGDAKNNMAIIQSLTFLMYFTREKNLLTKLYADCWDQSANQWTGACKNKPPTELDAAKYLKNSIRFTEDRKTGLLTISMQYPDPQIVTDWINTLVEISNQYLRSKASAQTEKNIDYISKELEQTREVEIRNVLFQMLEKEMQTKKLTGNKDEFAFEVIDPAFVPKMRVHPRRSMIAAFSVILGTMLGIVFVIIHSLYARIKYQRDGCKG